MVHRLITLILKVDRILKNGILDGNFNIAAQVQPRCSEFRNFVSQSSVLLAHGPPKGFDKIFRPKRGKNCSAAKSQGNGTAEKKPPTKNALKAPNQDSKLDGNGGGGDVRKKKSRGPLSDEEYVAEKIWVLLTIFSGTCVWFYLCWPKHRNEITWKDFVDNYLARGRVAKAEVIGAKWLRFQTAPGASADGTRVLRVRIDSLEPHEIVRPLAKMVGNAGREMKAGPENLLAVDEKLNSPQRAPIVVMQVTLHWSSNSLTRSIDRRIIDV